MEIYDSKIFTRAINDLVIKLKSRKDVIKRYTVKNFTGEKDFIILKNPSDEKQGGRNREAIYLTEETY